MAGIRIQQIEEQRPVAVQYPILPSRVNQALHEGFLRGRRRLIRKLPFPIEKKVKVLEVGCGNGYNLRQMARWLPNASITGLEASPDMLARAERATTRFRNRIKLMDASSPSARKCFQEPIDAILFSYSLTTHPTQWKDLIRQARESLRPGGLIAVADFHDSRLSWLKSYTSNQPMQIDGRLMPFLEQEFKPLTTEVHSACLGAWEYFLFLGRKDF